MTPVFTLRVVIASSVITAAFAACSLEGLGPLPSTSMGGSSTTSTTTSTSTSTSASTSTSTSSAAGGSGGAAVVRGWPDSPTAFCSDGSDAGVPCATASTQDGTSTDLATPSYEVGAGVVLDHVTGLTWIRTPNKSGLAWANRDTECQKHRTNQLGGLSDWRVPTLLELSSLLDSGAPNGTLDGAFTSPDPSSWSGSFWTTTVLSTMPTKAYYVNFNDGSATYNVQTATNRVTCVSGALPEHTFTVADGGATVIDDVTGLMWQKAAGSKRTWSLARQDCESIMAGSHTGWRLPTYKELLTLVDETRAAAPVLRPELDWPAGVGWSFWSSTPWPKTPQGAWTLASDGTTFSDLTTKDYYFVRCVRSLAAP